MADNKPLLDLMTGHDRERLTIDGTSYEIRAYSEMTMVQFHALVRMGEKTQKILSKDRLSEKDAKELTKISMKLVSTLIVDLPEDVNAKLTEAQRAQIFQVFTKLSPNLPKASGEQSPLESSLLASSASTGDNPGHG